MIANLKYFERTIQMKLPHRNLIVCGCSAFLAATLSSTAAQPETNSVNPDLKKKQDQLTLENSVAEQQLKKDLATLTAEKQRLELENGLAQQKLQARQAAVQAELDELTKKTDLLARQAALKEAERKSHLDDELAAEREKLEKLKLSNDLASAELTAKNRDITQHEQELRIKTAELQARTVELQAQRADFEMQLAKMNTDLDLREKKDQWKNRVNHDIAYTKEPFKDGILTVSDRRISLNGPIWMDTADYIAERIDYFNNQNCDYPIFIVIDSSPGGSVMAGYKILKAMNGSAAPVYVVVKSFAASMAANIATQAKKSYAYPNAIILHHQILSGSIGNLTEQKENIKDLEEWWKRLAAPVAAKMGLSLDDFIKKMYANRSTGNWEEFGDSARKLKWVDEIADKICEESYDKNPDGASGPHSLAQPGRLDNRPTLQERVDSNGRRYVLLPRLEAVDCYYLYNPDNYYRLTQ
jgi:ATP-dependent Clp protease protease subunit